MLHNSVRKLLDFERLLVHAALMQLPLARPFLFWLVNNYGYQYNNLRIVGRPSSSICNLIWPSRTRKLM
jgi:hypothetical protein